MSDQEYSAALLQALDTKIAILDAKPDDLLAIGETLGLVEAKMLIHAKNLDATSVSKCFMDVAQRMRKYQSVVNKIMEMVD